MNNPHNKIDHYQRGVVLVVALLMLLVLTLIGLAATRGTSLEERMAGNKQDYDIAFQAAEAGLINCEKFLNQVTLPPFDNSGYLYKQDPHQEAIDNDSDTPLWDSFNWGTDTSRSREYDGPALVDASGDPLVARNPRCIVEQLEAVPPPGGSLAADKPAQILMYRVTVQAWGASDNTVVKLQTTFLR